MRSVSELSLAELNELVRIRGEIEKLQARMAALLAQKPSVAAPRAAVRPVRKARGGLTRIAAVTKVLESAGKPLNTKEILEGLRAMGKTIASPKPQKSLGVLLYGAKTRGLFRKVSAGRFTVAAPPTVPAVKPPKARRKAKKS